VRLTNGERGSVIDTSRWCRGMEEGTTPKQDFMGCGHVRSGSAHLAGRVDIEYHSDLDRRSRFDAESITASPIRTTELRLSSMACTDIAKDNVQSRTKRQDQHE
jgi:hypothetical protein